MAATDSLQKWEGPIRPLIEEWVRSGEVSDQFRLLIKDLVRRQIGDFLSQHDDDAAFDGTKLARAITRDFVPDLDAVNQSSFQVLVQQVAATLLQDKEPTEITQCLWAWAASEKKEEFEARLFEVMNVELRKKITFNLRRFDKLQHKIAPDDLISELYIKLKGNEFLRFPENKLQFYSFAEKIIDNILRDLQRRANRQKRPKTERKITLTFERGLPLSLNIEEKLQVQEAIEKLKPRVAKIVGLHFNYGCTVDEIAEMLGISSNTVKRDLALGRQDLKKLLS